MSESCKPDPNPHTPLAYQRGWQDFYGRRFQVTPDVLIPRPETEQLIDLVKLLAGLPYLPGMRPPRRVLPAQPRILDVGTGSGCIAITLALEIPEAEIYASDISPQALELAHQNSLGLKASITPIISHLLKNVNTPLDLVVANLPYVDQNWPWLDKTALAYEPSQALYAADGGLALIKALILEASRRQISFLVLEADPCQHQAITHYASLQHYQLLRTMGFILGFQYAGA